MKDARTFNLLYIYIYSWVVAIFEQNLEHSMELTACGC